MMRRIKGAAVCCGVMVAGYLAVRRSEPALSSGAPQRGAEAVQALKRQGSFEGLRRAYEAARYAVEASGQAGWYRGLNPAQRLQAKFGPGEIRLEHPQGTVGMRLVGIGNGKRLAAPAGAEVVARGNRVEYRRGDVVEWYVNEAEGVEQGFTFDKRPAGARAGEPLVLVLETSGGLRPALNNEEGAIELRAGDKVVLRYGGLKSWDARGREVPSRMEVADREVWIRVDDSQAEYPLTVDPVFVQEQKLTAGDAGYGDEFGTAVAVAGDTALVGAPLDNIGAYTNQGSAYVFVRSGTTWTQQAKLTASDGTLGDAFGASVALSATGNTALIGAPGDDIGADVEQGSAYIFGRLGTEWRQVKRLTASDGSAHDYFGFSVSLDASYAVVGAYQDDIGAASNQGSAYVFSNDGVNWNQQAKLTASDGASEAAFGYSVSLSGDHALIGAPADNISADADQGAAYLFRRVGSTWTQEDKVVASDGAAGDSFGYSVSLSGGTALIGAPHDNVGANSDQGSAYVFTRLGSNWRQRAKLTASDGSASDLFGLSVALAGDTAVIGAHMDNIGAAADRGSVYVFMGSGSTWTQQGKLTAADGAAQDLLGRAVAVDGGTLLVGAPGESTSRGAAYVFVRAAHLKLYQRMMNALSVDTGWAQTGTWTVLSPHILTGAPENPAEPEREGAIAPESAASAAAAPVPDLAADPQALSVSPASGAGETQTFQAEYYHSGGAGRIKWVQLLLAASPTSGDQPYCLVHYDVPGNGFWLYSDIVGFFVGPFPPGAITNALQGNLCALRPNDSGVSRSGNTLRAEFALTFKQAAVRNTYLRAFDIDGQDSGWWLRGTYNPAVGSLGMFASVGPSSGSGSVQTFTLDYYDPPEFAGLPFGWVQFLIAAAPDGAKKPFCFLHYDRAGNGLWMYSSDVGYFLGPVAPGSLSSLLNSSACSINTRNTTVAYLSWAGVLRVTAPITMKTAMTP